MIREPIQRSSKLARRLAEISRRRAAGESLAPAGESGAEAGPRADAVGIEELLPGGVIEGSRGSVFVHERLRSAIEKPEPGWGRLRRGRRRALGLRVGPGPEWMWEDQEPSAWEGEGNGHAPGGAGGAAPGGAGRDSPGDSAAREDDSDTLAPDVLHRELEDLLRADLERVVFLDLETGGLGSACVFLAGTMRWSGEDFVLRQYFARHYAEEEALLHEVGRYLADAQALVTFNGKSFDVPLLRERATRHRVELRLPVLHVDLLHHSRAAWRGRVPNCRLTTLEAYVCRRRRSGDVPGEEIPALYHDYVKEGLVHRLIPVFHHNLLDVITMDELLRRLI